MKTSNETQLKEAPLWIERVLRVVGHLLLLEDGKPAPGIRSVYIVEAAHDPVATSAHDVCAWDRHDLAPLTQVQSEVLAFLNSALESAKVPAAAMEAPWVSARLVFDKDAGGVVGQMQLVEAVSFIAHRDRPTEAITEQSLAQAEGFVAA